MTQAERRSAPINIRCLNSQREIIDKAAAIAHKNRSDFMLEASCRAAENILLDQRLFGLDAKAYEAFENAISRPVANNPALANTLKTKAPWEK